ncbi:MAG TPA: hypothetical protein VFW71_07145 [Actinomycetota bacterium]|nr:hypothetical protein [Actinomycetota bacterium]
MDEAERAFHRDMVNGGEVLKREIGYSPTRFNQMVARHGGIAAARVLLRGPDASDGFTTLWEHRRLDRSVEAYVLLPWYENLFTEEERRVAKERLQQHGFDVLGFLRAAEQSAPPWSEGRDK